MDFAKPTEIAEQLAVTPETVRSMCRSGTLPAYRIGGSYRIRRSDFAKWLAAQAVSAEVYGNCAAPGMLEDLPNLKA